MYKMEFAVDRAKFERSSKNFSALLMIQWSYITNDNYYDKINVKYILLIL